MQKGRPVFIENYSKKYPLCWRFLGDRLGVWGGEKLEIEIDNTNETIEEVVEELADVAETAIEELGEAVETIAEAVETISEDNSEPTIPEHDHEHSHDSLERKVAELEEKVDVLVQREIADIVEESQESESPADTEPTEEIPIAEEVVEEPTIIEPPADRAVSNEPSGIWSFFKKIGW